jgi:peptidoglycan/xylan/chitin deacetylase (PgdA/CDA1 family)
VTRILTYHDVLGDSEDADTGFSGVAAGRYKVLLTDFRAHLDAIAAAGIDVGLLEPGRRSPRAVLSFDDGGASALLAARELERRGWRGHFLVTTGRIGSPGFLDREGVVELARRGHAVGSHSVSHPTYFGRLAPAEMAREWRESATVLAALLGEPPSTASVPGGFVTSAVLESAGACGYRLLMTSRPTSRSSVLGELSVVGRYTIRDRTPAAVAAALAGGPSLSAARQRAAWTAKQAAKRLGPRTFERLRRARARPV